MNHTDFWADDALVGLIVHQQRYQASASNTNFISDLHMYLFLFSVLMSEQRKKTE